MTTNASYLAAAALQTINSPATDCRLVADKTVRSQPFTDLLLVLLACLLPFAAIRAQGPLQTSVPPVATASPSASTPSPATPTVGRATMPPASGALPAQILQANLIEPMQAGATRVRDANSRMVQALATYRTKPASDESRRELLATTLAAIEETRGALESQLQHEDQLLQTFQQQLASLGTQSEQDDKEREAMTNKVKDAKSRLAQAERQRDEALVSPKPSQERLMQLYDAYRTARREAHSAEEEIDGLAADSENRVKDREEILSSDQTVRVYYHDVRDQASELASLSRRLARAGRRLEVQEVLTALGSVRAQIQPGQLQLAEQVRNALTEMRRDEAKRPSAAVTEDPDFRSWIEAGKRGEKGGQ